MPAVGVPHNLGIIKCVLCHYPMQAVAARVLPLASCGFCAAEMVAAVHEAPAVVAGGACVCVEEGTDAECAPGCILSSSAAPQQAQQGLSCLHRVVRSGSLQLLQVGHKHERGSWSNKHPAL